MNDLFAVVLVVVLGAALAAVCARGFSRRERRWVMASFAMHVAFASTQVPLTLSFYGSSDMFLYFSYGEILAQMMERDPAHVIPEITTLLLHDVPRIPITIIGAGTSTGSMSALAAWSFYILGPSKFASCIAFALLSLCGKLGLYRAFRANVASDNLAHVAIATLFVPSFVFWSSGLIKEAVAMTGFGWSVYGIHLIVREGRFRSGSLVAGLGAIPIVLTKPYILFPLLLAAGGWYYWARSLRRGRVVIRPGAFLLAGALGLGGIVVLGQYFPEYAPESFSDHAYQLQQIGRGRGGSSFALGESVPTTPLGQLAYAPVALVASLFRPVIFEARNLLMLANAAETTVLTLLLLRALFTRGFARVRKQIMEDPFLVFCLLFVVAFGVAVGLASTNLGTLSRYRSPILPFFALVLLVLQPPRRSRTASPTKAARHGRVMRPVG